MNNESDFYHNVSDGRMYVSEEYLLKQMNAALRDGIIGGFILGAFVAALFVKLVLS